MVKSKKDEAQSSSANPPSSGGVKKDSKPKANRKAKPKVYNYASVEPKHGSCKQWTLQVSNQKSPNHCSYFAYAYCVTTYFKMKGLLDINLFLSAQCLADWGFYDWQDIAWSCSMLGLMTTEDYPYEAVPRPPLTSLSDYLRAGVARYRVKDFIAYLAPAKIKRQLVLHFCLGPGYACIGSVHVGELKKCKASDNAPYHHPPDSDHRDSSLHSVLIVGVNISGEESDHYCEIKNSWGKSWAKDGFTKIGFEVLNQVEFLVERDEESMILR